MTSKEVRVTDPSGGQKGQKLAELGTLDPRSLWEVAEVAGFGNRKYETFNYTRGFRYSLSYNALLRHVLLWLGGEDHDPESGKHHLAHAAWHCFTLMAFQRYRRGTDDRFPLRPPTE